MNVTGKQHSSAFRVRHLGALALMLCAGIPGAMLAGTPSADAAALRNSAAAALPAAAQAPSNRPMQVSATNSIQATIDNFVFAPKELTVKAGSTVEWTNKDDSPHTVTSDDGAFASPVMDTNQSFHYTFQKPGRFSYHCKLHPKMTGVVVVQ